MATINEEVRPIEKMREELYQVQRTLDDTISWIKKWTVVGDTELYLVEFYEWDDWWYRYHELYTDRKEAENRFFQLVKRYFDQDLKYAWISEDFNWKELESIDVNWFRFTRDRYAYYVEKYWQDPKYPKYVRAAYNIDWYNEITLETIHVNKPIYTLTESKWQNQ